jgi:hypothetical protein
VGKYALILVAAGALSFGSVQGSLNGLGEGFTRLLVERHDETLARLTANSMAQIVLSTLNDSLYWRAGYGGVGAGGGTGAATLEDSGSDSTLGPGLVRIRASGLGGTVADTVVVLAVVPFWPAGVEGAITANSDVRTLGSLVVDARDHDMAGNLIAGQGTKGVSTTQTLLQSGSSKVGGTGSDGIDHIPAKPGHVDVIEEFAPGPFPNGPDGILGYATGSLKAMAQSGANGGQYVTDPALLSMPLSGVTYVELPSGGTWQSMDFGASEGVLVVHNSSTNAGLKNLNSGIFKGLIIADDIEKIHMTILGAVVSMTTSPSGNCIGNGTGDVFFSREAVHRATSLATGGDGDVTVVSWYE